MWKLLIKINAFKRKFNEKLGFTEKVDVEIFFVTESLVENKLEGDGETLMEKALVFTNEEYVSRC